MATACCVVKQILCSDDYCLFVRFRCALSYLRALDKMGEIYENHLRDRRLRETSGDDYQNLRIGKSKMTVLEFESKVLTLQQKSVDRAYEDLMAKSELTYAEGKYATVLGNFIDQQVRFDMRYFAKLEGINDSATSNIWAINRRLKSDDLPYYGVPDGRLGLNILHDTTLARKDGYTEQIQKWKSLREVSNFVIIRPTERGGSYVIPRASILPYKAPAQNFGRKV